MRLASFEKDCWELRDAEKCHEENPEHFWIPDLDIFEVLITNGHKIVVEYDSEEKREKSRDEMYLSILKAGKKLTINEIEIESEADYWRWKGHA